jgi:hypothetical protein
LITCGVVQKSRISHIKKAFDKEGLFRCRIWGQNLPMIKQDKKSWNKGRIDAMRGMPSKCPKSLDPLAYSSGYIEGEAQRAKRPLRVISSPKPRKDAP